MSEELETKASPRFQSILVLVALSLFVLLVLGGLRTYRDLSAARAREAELRQGLADTRGRIGELEERIDQLRGDPMTLERLAREELGMVKPGELVILVEDAAAETAEELVEEAAGEPEAAAAERSPPAEPTG